MGITIDLDSLLFCLFVCLSIGFFGALCVTETAVTWLPIIMKSIADAIEPMRHAKTRRIIDGFHDREFKSQAHQTFLSNEIATLQIQLEVQTTKSIQNTKQYFREIDLTYGTNGSNGLIHLQEEVRAFQNGQTYQQYQSDIAASNHKIDTLKAEVTRLKDNLEYENSKVADLHEAQIEYRNEIQEYKYQLRVQRHPVEPPTSAPDLPSNLTQNTESITVTSDDSADKITTVLPTLSMITTVFEVTPIASVFPQPVLLQQPPQLPSDYQTHLTRSTELDDIQTSLTNLMASSGAINPTQYRATNADVKCAIEVELPKYIQDCDFIRILPKAYFFLITHSKQKQTTLNELQSITNESYNTLSPDEAAYNGPISPKIYLKAISKKVENLEQDIQSLRNAQHTVQLQAPVPSGIPSLRFSFNVPAASSSVPAAASSANVSAPAAPIFTNVTPVVSEAMALAKKNDFHQEKHFVLYNNLVSAMNQIQKELDEAGLEPPRWTKDVQKSAKVHNNRFVFSYNMTYDELIRVGKRFSGLYANIQLPQVLAKMPSTRNFTDSMGRWEELKDEWDTLELEDHEDYDLKPADDDKYTKAVVTMTKCGGEKRKTGTASSSKAVSSK